MLVEQDVAGGGQRVHRQVEAHRAVVEHLHRELGGADEAQHARFDHLAVEWHGNVFLALRELRGARGIRLGACVEGQTVGRARLDEHPGAPERAFHAVELPLGLRLQQHAPLLGAARAGRVGGRAEVQRHAVLGEHAAGPGAPVEADADGDGLLHRHLQAPGAELLRHPLLGVIEHVRAHQAPADVAGDVVRVLHRAVVGAAQLEDRLRHFILRVQGERQQQGGAQGKPDLFHTA